MSALSGSAQIPPADLHIPILGQLALAQLPLGDAITGRWRPPLCSRPPLEALRLRLG
jgi:hypothetical protein